MSQVRCLKQAVVGGQVAVALPEKSTFLCLDWARFQQTHVHVNLNRPLHYFTVDGFTVALARDLVKQRFGNLVFKLHEDSVFEHDETVCSDWLQRAI